LEGKARSVSTALNRIDLEPERSDFLAELSEVPSSTITPNNLLGISRNLLALAGQKGKKRVFAGSQTDLARITSLRREFGTYTYYLATVLELFSTDRDETGWRRCEETGAWDDLARIRQALSESATVGESLLTRFRSNRRLEALE